MSSPRAKPPEPAKKPFVAAIRESGLYIRRALALVWRSSPGLLVAFSVCVVASALLGPAIALAGKRIVDSVVDRSSDATLRWVLVELGLVIAQATISRTSGLVRSVLGSRLGTDINISILERAQRLELHHFEDSEFYDRLTRARREASSRPVQLVSETFSLVQSVLTLAGYSVLLVRFSGWVVLALTLATIPATIAEMKYSKQGFRMRNWRSPDARRLTYLEYVLANDEHAKEVKLFGLGPLFLGRYKELAERFHREDSKLMVTRTIVTYGLSLLATLAFYGAYAAMAILTALGRLTLGNMTLYVAAFRSGQQSFQSILSGIGSIYEHNLYMSNLFAFLDSDLDARPAVERRAAGAPVRRSPAMPGRKSANVADGATNGAGGITTSGPARSATTSSPPGAARTTVGDPSPGETRRESGSETQPESGSRTASEGADDRSTSVPASSSSAAFGDGAARGAVTRHPPERDERGIRLENVSFKYPGQDKWVLENVSLFIPKGQSVAIVGQNGAGKTTLIKLVTRLYKPNAGHIYLDGQDVEDWDRDALLSRFGVVFQDFNQYQLKFRENIGVGSVAHLEDDDRITRATEQGGAEAVLAKLTDGIDTQLGRWFNDGAELSGGQWQKVALARGFMREEAEILVLDEPTAALDAEAEHAVFERFRQLTTGRTTIIISHRFPTVRMADRILVIENGVIAEDGTHAELLARPATYARLYSLQAKGYA